MSPSQPDTADLDAAADTEATQAAATLEHAQYPPIPTHEQALAQAQVDDVLEAMRDVVDPELGINIVDLGLVYGLTVEKGNIAVIDMTLTSAACPLTEMIEDQIRGALSGLVDDYRLNWVWMPPWGVDKITEDGREQLRALGFTI